MGDSASHLKKGGGKGEVTFDVSDKEACPRPFRQEKFVDEWKENDHITS